MAAQIAFIVRLSAKPERREEFEALLFPILDTMAKEPDFVNTFVSRADDDPDTFVLYESWACSREHFINHHLKRDYRMTYEAMLPDLLARERTIEFLTPIRSYAEPMA